MRVNCACVGATPAALSRSLLADSELSCGGSGPGHILKRSCPKETVTEMPASSGWSFAISERRQCKATVLVVRWLVPTLRRRRQHRFGSPASDPYPADMRSRPLLDG